MVADCSANCARWIICLSNFILVCIGTVLLVLGTWLAADKASFINFSLNVTNNKYILGSNFTEDAGQILQEFVEPAVIEQAAYILVALGAFIFIISFLGYCGAVKESRVLLSAYGVFLIIIIALQIALVILWTLYKSQAEHHSKGFLKSTLSKYYTTGDHGNAVSLSWDLVMAHMNCCGVDGYTDFRTAKLFVEMSSREGLGRQVPESCCTLSGDPLLLNPTHPSCTTRPTQSNSHLSTGCYTKFSHLVRSNLNLVIGAVVIIATTQLLSIIFSFCLCKAVGQERTDYMYKY